METTTLAPNPNPTAKSKSRKRWLLGGLAGVALVAVLTGGVALADSGTLPHVAGLGGKRHALRQQFRAQLATDLGLSDEQLTATFQKAANETIDAAVTQGTLTQAQGAALKQKVANGELGNLLGGDRGRAARVKHAVGADIAGQLGLTPEELKSELASGQTLNAIITAHGKTVDEVVNGVITDAQTKLDTGESKLLDALRQRLTNAIQNNALPGSNTATPSATPTS